jgi:PPM family protein phosphatase
MARPTLANPFRFLDEHIRQVHDAIDRHALLSDMPEPPRTTIVTALVQHDALYCAHAGDSRLYHFRNGQLLFRTEDHSKVQMLYRKGLISKEAMLTHPERNKIYNCVGGEEQPQIEIYAPTDCGRCWKKRKLQRFCRTVRSPIPSRCCSILPNPAPTRAATI